MALEACMADPWFGRFDPKQQGVIKALCHESKPHIIVTGGAGSGKTTVVNFAVKKLAAAGVAVLRVAVSDLTAERFGGGDAVNLMLFFSILKTHCDKKVHYTAEENPAVAAFLKKIVNGRVLVAIDEFGLMSATDLSKVVDLLWRACQRSARRFQNVQLVLIGDPGGQMPPIKGESVVFASALKKHESDFCRRLMFFKLTGNHRFSASAREYMQHVLGCDASGRQQYVDNQKKLHKKYPCHRYINLLKSRAGCEWVVRGMADRLYGGLEMEETRIGSPPHAVGMPYENSSKFTPGAFIVPTNGDVAIVEVTAWSQRIFAESCEDPERKIRVTNRQRFHISAGSFHDLPPCDEEFGSITPPKTLGASAPSVTVFIDGEEARIPLFVKNSADGDGSLLALRQVGFATPSEDGDGYEDLGMAQILFNAQGDQFPGKRIVVGSDRDASGGTRLRLADYRVAVSRTSDPNLVIFHPAVRVVEDNEETKRYGDIRKRLATIDQAIGSIAPAGRPHPVPTQSSRRPGVRLCPSASASASASASRRRSETSSLDASNPPPKRLKLANPLQKISW